MTEIYNNCKKCGSKNLQIKVEKFYSGPGLSIKCQDCRQWFIMARIEEMTENSVNINNVWTETKIV